MILTGKALEEFLRWIYYAEDTNQVEDSLIYKESERFISNQDERFILSLITEWLDSVGIYISLNYVCIFDEMRYDTGFESYVTNVGLSTKFRTVETRQEATKQAIIKANEIYNSL